MKNFDRDPGQSYAFRYLVMAGMLAGSALLAACNHSSAQKHTYEGIPGTGLAYVDGDHRQIKEAGTICVFSDQATDQQYTATGEYDEPTTSEYDPRAESYTDLMVMVTGNDFRLDIGGTCFEAAGVVVGEINQQRPIQAGETYSYPKSVSREAA